ncbi:MAG: hypothetical protein IJ454_01475, partial [Clostridia bacterium]|nr:hypothetical protein [Clostridia bacterium]
MILLSIIMVMTMAMPVAFAEETAAVDITFADATMEANSETGLRITNLINQKADNAAVEGYYV